MEEQTTWLSSTIHSPPGSPSTRPGTRSSTSSDSCRASRGQGHRADEPGRSQGGDRGEDGRDVDEVHRHRGGRREGPDAHRAVMEVKSREAGGQGHANANASPSRSRTAAGTSTPRLRSPARRRRWARGSSSRPRRDDQGLRGETRHDLMPRKTMRRIRRERFPTTAGPPSRRTPAGPCSAATARRLRLRRVREPPGRGDGSRAHGQAGPIRCGRCRTVNVSAEVPVEPQPRAARRGATAEDAERRLVVLPGVDVARKLTVDIDTLHPLGVRLDQRPDRLVAVERAQVAERRRGEDERVPQLSAVARDRRPGTLARPRRRERRSAAARRPACRRAAASWRHVAGGTEARQQG